MDTDVLYIKVLGGFSMRWGEAEITVTARSRKLYLLLAYLIGERNRHVPYRDLVELFWPGQGPSATSLNALKALLHRARVLLDQLKENAGRTLIQAREGGCQWNPEVPVKLDEEEFVRLCRSAERARGEKKRLELSMEALSLYRGDYLPALADHPWAQAREKELHQIYLRAALNVLPLLKKQGRLEEAAELSGASFALEPDREDLCQAHMEALLLLDRRQEAARAYEDFQERLLVQKGVMPSDVLRELYRQAQRDSDPREISPVTLLERLLEEPQTGALLCEYDFFRAICRSMSRVNERTGANLHVALISLTGAEGGTLAQHSLDRAMDNLQEIIRAQLRRGDTFARCSASQFVLLLPQADYENGQMICSRITRAFVRQYPHSPALLLTSVQPMPCNRPN